jgi:hypothetical protein
MNHAAAEALVQAQLNGVRQIKGAIADGTGGYCAMGVIFCAGVSLNHLYEIHVDECPECGATSDGYYQRPISTQYDVVVHLNNDHGWSFLDIARKLEDSEAA